MNSNFIVENIGKIAASAGIIVATFVIRFITKNALKFAFAKVSGRFNEKRLAKTKTVRSLLLNIINFGILLIAVLMILGQWGVNIGPLLAGLGVLSVGLSFGSQSMVKDFIGGFFIIMEDVFNIGDFVKIGAFEGEVRKMTIRSTVLRDTDGNRIYIPNSKIDIVTRFKPKKKK